MASPIKSLIGQTAIYGVSSIVGRFINYLLVPFYTYIFRTYEFGVVAELTAYVTIFLVLLTYGMETAFFRYCQNENYSRKTVYSTVLGSVTFTSLIFIGLTLIFGYKIAVLIDYKENPEFIILLGLTVTLDAFSAIPFAKLRIENRARRFATVKFANILINVFLNVFFLFLLPKFAGKDNIVYNLLYHKIHVGYIFIAYFITSLLTLIMLLPEIKEGFVGFKIDYKLLRKLLVYGFPILLAGLAGMFSESFDRILLKYLIVVPEAVLQKVSLGLKAVSVDEVSKKYIMEQLGIYGANVRIAVIMTLFLQAFRYAAEPFFFNYSKKDDSRLIYARVMKYFVSFSLFVFLVVTLGLDIIKYLIGSDYRSGLVVVPLLLLSKLFFGVVFNLSIWYKLKNLTRYGSYIAFIGAGSSIVLNFLFIPLFGYIGAAWASIISYFLMMTVSFIWEKKNYAIPYEYKTIAIYFFTTLIFYLINYFTRKFTEYYIFLNFLMIFAFVYLFIKREKINVKNVILALKKK